MAFRDIFFTTIKQFNLLYNIYEGRCEINADYSNYNSQLYTNTILSIITSLNSKVTLNDIKFKYS